MAAGCARSGTGAEPHAVWGEQGLRDGAFLRPRAIGAWRGEVYVVDTTGRVQVFSPEGEFHRMWTVPEHENGTPTAIAFKDDRVFIPDTHYSRILEYSPKGDLLTQWGAYGSGPDQFIYPTGIALLSDSRYAISEYGEDAERVRIFDAEHNVMHAWGGHGKASGKFNRAMAIAALGETLYVADTANHRVQIFSADGQHKQDIGGAGAEPGQLKYPHDLCVTPGETILVAEYGNHRISHFASDGAFLGYFGAAGRAPGAFNAPRGVAVDDEGAVYVADTDNHRIQAFREWGGGA